jgi:putative endonuclease
VNVSVKQPPKLKKKNFLWQLPKKQLGTFGEERAVQFLNSQNFQILAKNIRLLHDEIDLVAWDRKENELVFVEVKTRRQIFSGDPSLAINRRKLFAMVRAAHVFLRKHWQKPTAFRIDVIAVSPGKISHTPNVTWEMVK